MNVTKLVLLFGVAAVASAGSFTFNFNSLTPGQSDASMSSTLTSLLVGAGCTGCSVSITGAYADTTYNADGNTTGPGSSGLYPAPTSLTLGDSNGATASNSNSTVSGSYDTFLATTNQSNTANSDDQITMTFSGFTINGAVSFDYEIFPDINCTALTRSGCGGAANGQGIYPDQPDFKFATNNNSDVFTTYGVAPGTTNGSALYSPNSFYANSSYVETAPQYIGTWSGTHSNTSTLDFVDWPATIGVDNLSISWNSPDPVPDPSSIFLLGTVAAGIVLRKKLWKTT